MADFLSTSEIYDRFDSEWILVDQPETDEMGEVQGGSVIAHSKDRDEVYRRAIELETKRFAILYTGELPKDAVIVL